MIHIKASFKAPAASNHARAKNFFSRAAGLSPPLQAQYTAPLGVQSAPTRQRLGRLAAALLGVLGIAQVQTAAATTPFTDDVPTEYGSVRGVNLAGIDGVSVSSFIGLPYAAPPVGNLRWKPPAPPASWTGTRDSWTPGNACPQPVRSEFSIGQQGEDCLVLNVWSKATDATSKWPVIVWIHGGGLYSGAATNGLWLASAHDVVVVTINYRLGALGFLAHPLLSAESTTGVSGNYGMMDQIAALQWVKNNIVNFGGNPNNITVMGQSAGGTSVTALMTSPLLKNKGLMHKAIVMSAAASGKLKVRDQAVEDNGSMETKGVDFQQDLLTLLDLGNPLDRMREKPFDQVVNAWSSGDGEPGDGTSSNLSVDGSVLTEQPLDAFHGGRQLLIPFLTGTVEEEGNTFGVNSSINTLGEWTNYVINRFGGSVNSVVNAILDLYPAPTDAEARTAYQQLNGDMFVCPTRHQARIMAAVVPKKTFLYQFTRTSLKGLASGLGAYHGSDVPYAFFNAAHAGGFTPEDETVSKNWMAYLVTFARYGKPAYGGGSNPYWPPYQTATDKHQVIDYPISTGQQLRKTYCDYLDENVFQFTDP